MPIYEFLCGDCGEISTVMVLGAKDRRKKLRCDGCGGRRLEKLVSRPGLVRAESGSSGGAELRPVAPRKMVEKMSRTYDSAGVDPGGSFDEISRAARRGDHPETLKEAVREAKAKQRGLEKQSPERTGQSPPSAGGAARPKRGGESRACRKDRSAQSRGSGEGKT